MNLQAWPSELGSFVFGVSTVGHRARSVVSECSSEVVPTEHKPSTVLLQPFGMNFVLRVVFFDYIPEPLCMILLDEMGELVDNYGIDDIWRCHHEPPVQPHRPCCRATPPLGALIPYLDFLVLNLHFLREVVRPFLESLSRFPSIEGFEYSFHRRLFNMVLSEAELAVTDFGCRSLLYHYLMGVTKIREQLTLYKPTLWNLLAVRIVLLFLAHYPGGVLGQQCFGTLV